jgi:hypothetical protein
MCVCVCVCALARSLSLTESHARSARSSLVQLLGVALHTSRTAVVKHVNELLHVPSTGFTHSDPAVRLATFASWCAVYFLFEMVL